jgi:hypothetical protein
MYEARRTKVSEAGGISVLDVLVVVVVDFGEEFVMPH